MESFTQKNKVLKTATGNLVVRDGSYVFQDESGNTIRIPIENFQCNEIKENRKQNEIAQCDKKGKGRNVEEIQMEEDDDVQFIEQSTAKFSNPIVPKQIGNVGPKDNVVASNRINGSSSNLKDRKEEPPRKLRKTGCTRISPLKIRQQELEHKIKMDEINAKQRQEYLDIQKKRNELLEKIFLQGLLDF